MAPAKDIATRLRAFLNAEKLTLSDLRRGMVILSNGKLRPEGRSSILGHPRKPNATTSMVIEDAEHCAS